ncbi:serine/threonine-protein kinase [Microcella daejeonensis]|uniref:non-specific serine/threonine protein kinase n=1 Tax=Microcella daejeonensis TaxID=2994971 RepID=A0A9E8S9N8_9MICO|nr:serine/threonine-protein kinase [Microcella daejeonensis]WAB81711.1 serine/threonine-protein kinase [Microcella daejeonensis]
MRRAGEPPILPGLEPVRLLGSGGFADVFLYEQQLPRRKVAVKVLLADDLSTQSTQAFVAEANLMAQLSAHPYIVTIYGAAVADDGRPYFVMEYCAGPSLAEQYKRRPFSITDALRVGVRISGAVATAHAAGILHRDIKPANVLTNDYGWPALTDFGISSAVESELPVHTTTSRRAVEEAATTGGGQTVGMSIPWSPPEMFADDPRPDVRSDVFALAATVHTLLAGRSPFEVEGRSNGALDLIGRIERGIVTPMPRADLPRSLIAVLAKGMASAPADRFASAIEFGRALQRVEMELGFQATTLDVPQLAAAETATAEPSSPDADETRVRGVSVIQAQAPAAPAAPPVIPPPPAPAATGAASPAVVPESTVIRGAETDGATAVTGSAPLDATVMRGAGIADTVRPSASPAPAPPVPAPPSTDRDADGRDREGADARDPAARRRNILIGSIGAVVLAAIVAVAVVVGPTVVPADESPSTAPDAGGGAVVDVIEPPGILPGAVEADGTVTFTVTNPDPKERDVFRWFPVTNPSDTAVVQESAEGRIVVEGVAPGTQVCIAVAVQRAGSLSPTTEGCTP